MICNVKRCFHSTTIFLRKMVGGLVAVKFMVNIVVCYCWIGSFDVRSLNSCKCVARWIFVSLLAVKGNCLAVSRVILRTLDE